MTRPRRFSVLAALLVATAFGAIGAALNASSHEGALRDVGVGYTVLLAAAVAYALTALAAAVGLWRVRSWAFAALALWASVVVISNATFALVASRRGLPLAAAVGGFVFLVIVMAVLMRFVRRGFHLAKPGPL